MVRHSSLRYMQERAAAGRGASLDRDSGPGEFRSLPPLPGQPGSCPALAEQDEPDGQHDEQHDEQSEHQTRREGDEKRGKEDGKQRNPKRKRSWWSRMVPGIFTSSKQSVSAALKWSETRLYLDSDADTPLYGWRFSIVWGRWMDGCMHG